MDTIQEIINNNILKYLDKTSLEIEDKCYSYRELDEFADRIAQRIIRESKIVDDKGVYVGVCLPRKFCLLSAIWAICKLGYTYVPLDPELPIERMKYIIEDCKMPIIITEGNLTKQFSDITVIDLLEQEAEDNKEREISLIDDVNKKNAYVIYTSGTTGKPKGVPITYQNLLNMLHNLSLPSVFNISEKSKILNFASINFDASILEIYSGLFYGGTLIMATEKERRDVQLLSELIRKTGVTFMTLPPSLVVLFQDLNFKSLDTLAVVGEKMLPNIVQRVNQYSYRLINGYGPTENTVMSTVKIVDSDINIQNIGTPVPGVVAHVVHEDLTCVKVGESGELCLGGGQLTLGYLNRSELNRQKFFANPFADAKVAPILYKTGDLVRLMKDGSFDFIGRKDTQVKINGYRIELGEIVQQIDACEDVVQSCVLVVNDSLVAYVKLKNNCLVESVIKQIRWKLKEFLPFYMQPSSWVIIDEFPRTINGKVDLEKLKNVKQNFVKKLDKKRNSQEDMMAHVIGHIIGQDFVDIDSDFFDDLGMTSIQIMQIPISLEILGIYVSVNDIYENRTIRKIIKNHSMKRNYWFNQPVKGKPVLIIVSGYTSFSFLYTKLAQALSDLYAIYVLESYHEAPWQVTVSCDDIVKYYMKQLASVVSQYKIAAITGFCVGGELGLLLAYKLSNEYSLFPHVIVLDGEVKRSKDKEDYIPLDMDFLSSEINQARFERDLRMVCTMPDFHYEGKVTSILANQFMSDFMPLSKKSTVTEKQRQKARYFYNRTPKLWKQYYPDCVLFYVEADHWSYLHTPESIEPIVEYIRSLVVENRGEDTDKVDLK